MAKIFPGLGPWDDAFGYLDKDYPDPPISVSVLNWFLILAHRGLVPGR